MSKNIAIIVLFVMLTIIPAFPANAAIQATIVEIRGQIAQEGNANTGMMDTTKSAVSWTPYNFAGFYYDLKNDLGAESLQIGNNSLSGRTICEGGMSWCGGLIYTTHGQAKTLKVVENLGYSNASANGLKNFSAGEMAAGAGQFDIVGWQTQPYVGIKNHSYKLAKLIIEQGNATSEKKTLTVNDTWNIGGGWTLTATFIDSNATPKQVRLNLSKDGIKKNETLLYEKKIFTYVESNIANETNVPLFGTYIDSIFHGATSDIVQLRYTWAIDTNITELRGGDKYGVFNVVTTEPVVLANTKTTVTLSRDTKVNLIGALNFRTADSDTARFYPEITYTDPGMYEIRGTIAQEGNATTGMMDTTAGAVGWTPYNFAGFYYDLKNDLGTESLIIGNNSLSSRTVCQNGQAGCIGFNGGLIYTTHGQAKMLYAVMNGKATDSSGSCNANGSCTFNGLRQFDAGQMSSIGGAYTIMGWQAQPYVGVKGHSYKLAKLIIEQQNATSDKKTITVGDTWDIGGGWTLTANSIDAKASPRQVWLTLSKDGVEKDEAVVQQGQIYTYVEPNIDGDSDVPLFVTYVDSIFSGATSDVVQFRYTWAIDTSITQLNGGDIYGVFKVVTTEPVVLANTDSTITLSRDMTVNLMGELNFRVADSDVVRFYPSVTYQILQPPPPPQPFDTLHFEPNNWNLVSVPKTLNNSAVNIAFNNLSLDANNIKWYYNASTNVWEHPSDIMPLRGYWVYNNASSQVYQKLWFKNMAGPNVPPSMLLKAGWNLIGHTSQDYIPVQSALISIDGKYSHLLTYSPAEGWKMYIVGNPSLQQFNVFEPGRGYWIFMTQDATYAAVDV